MYAFQNKWAGILSQKHRKPFMSWQKRLQNDEVNVSYLLHTVEYTVVFYRLQAKFAFFVWTITS